MAIKRAEFEIVASVKPDSAGAAQLSQDLKDVTGNAEEMRGKMHELHEVIHVVARNSGELGHVLHYVLSPEAFGVAAAIFAMKEFKKTWDDLNEPVRAYAELIEKLNTDKIDALAKSFRDAKIAAAEYHDELAKHGGQQGDADPQTQLSALEHKYGLAGGASYGDRIAKLRSVAEGAVGAAKAGEKDTSATDQDNVAAAQKALDDYKKNNDPNSATHIAAEILSGKTEKDRVKEKAAYAEEIEHLKAVLDAATDLQRINDAKLKAEQAHTEELKKQGEADSDAFSKLTAAVADSAAKLKNEEGITAEKQKQQIIDDANAAGAPGWASGFGQREFGAQFGAIAVAGSKAANFGGDSAALARLIALDIQLHNAYEAKFGVHEDLFKHQGDQLQAILSHLNNGRGTPHY